MNEVFESIANLQPDLALAQAVQDTGSAAPSALSASPLSAVEINAIELFVRIANLFRISRSIGEIYGLLFVTATPASFDCICRKLNISVGSASHGLRFLRNVGAVSVTYLPGDRRDFFIAETRLRRLASGFLRERITPNLADLEGRMDRLHDLLKEAPHTQATRIGERVLILQTWRKQARALLPLLVQGLESDPIENGQAV